MRVTAGQLNRATLARQLLLRRERIPVAEAVRRVMAIQAQEPASPYLALWNRVAGFDAAELDRAFALGTVIKATLMRMTLHAVHADDYADLHGAMQPFIRADRLRDARFASSGLSSADVDAALRRLLAFTQEPRTGPEIEAMLDEEHGPRSGQLWFALRFFGPLVHAPTGGPWSFGAPRRKFRSANASDPVDAKEALRRYALRYLGGFGPATVADIAGFARVSRVSVRAALASLGEELTRLEGPDGETLYDILGAPLPAADFAAPPRLMAMWDSTLLAHADRSRIIPADYRAAVIRTNGDVLPTLLVDGRVAGVWRGVEGGIEATAFRTLPADAWDGLEAEARALMTLLAPRQPAVYSRYARWWSALPAAEVRVLGG